MEDDSRAFEILFRKYYPVLCLLSKRYTHDMTTSREVVQDIFIYLWEQRKELEISTSLKSYLSAAVRYNSIRRLNDYHKVIILTDKLPDNSRELHDHLEYAELQTSILEAIETLPEQCRKVFIMSRFDELKYSEIAQQLKLSVKTIEAHISKALRLIQAHMDKTMIGIFIAWLYDLLQL
jgi:RNA polymerase sigma-70 factor (ECF subfamily)